jgi:DNA-binding transcriptional regulator YbjK
MIAVRRHVSDLGDRRIRILANQATKQSRPAENSSMEVDGAMKAKNSSSRSEPTRVSLMAAALQVIAETGVKSVTHRKICAAANLSLGTVNYHYADLNQLLLDAFSCYVDEVSAKYEDSFPIAHNDDDLADAVLRLIAALSEDTKSAILMWELYAEAGRDKTYRRLVQKWSRRAKSGVEQFCSSTTATALEALWDGAVMQRILGDAHLSEADLRKVILAVIRLDGERAYPAQTSVPAPRGTDMNAARPRRVPKATAVATP